MGAQRLPIIGTGITKGDPAIATRLKREIEGEVLFDSFSRGRYSTDASHYQIEPIGVVVAKTEQDVRTAIEIAAEEGIPLLPRGGGTSQCGQTVGEALVVKHQHRVLVHSGVNCTDLTGGKRLRKIDAGNLSGKARSDLANFHYFPLPA